MRNCFLDKNAFSFEDDNMLLVNYLRLMRITENKLTKRHLKIANESYTRIYCGSLIYLSATFNESGVQQGRVTDQSNNNSFIELYLRIA